MMSCSEAVGTGGVGQRELDGSSGEIFVAVGARRLERDVERAVAGDQVEGSVHPVEQIDVPAHSEAFIGEPVTTETGIEVGQRGGEAFRG